MLSRLYARLYHAFLVIYHMHVLIIAVGSCRVCNMKYSFYRKCSFICSTSNVIVLFLNRNLLQTERW